MHNETLAPGFVVAGKYVIERTLGRGGMGAVYVAAHANTGKRLALKCLLPEFVPNADIVGRFLREAQVMGRLQHRHVVDVFDVGRDGDVLYIVMELLEGKPLADLLQDAALTLEEALLIMLRAMEGVAAAHDHGVIHRDLKPDNIFVCVGASGRLDDPRVLDFGISKLEDAAQEQLTRSGVAMGTPYYMSIEQLNGQRDLDPRVDVYALGVILYEAIAGEPPYVADSISALAIRVLTTQAVHLGRLRPDLPPGLADVVMKAMAKNRDDRYRSVRQLIEALRPFVPRSAGLLVPEGQSRPLRTPRSGRVPRPSQTEIDKVASRQHPVPTGSRAPSSHAAQAGSAGSAPERSARGASRRGRWLAVAALLAISGALAFVVHERPGLLTPTSLATPAPPAQPELPPAAPTVAGEAARIEPPTLEPTPVLAAKRPEPLASPPSVPPAAPVDGGLAGAVGGAPAVPHEPAARKPSRSTGRNERARARAEVTEPSPAASPEPRPASLPPPAAVEAAQRRSAEGRAGKLGSDEF